MAISKNITISQIARRANVSTATASRAINNPGLVREETRARVLQAMKELNFQVKHGEDKIILASFADFVNPFYAECINGMQTAARQRGYQLFLQQIDSPQLPAAYTSLLTGKLFQGALFCHALPAGETLDNLRMKYPIVMCSQHSDDADIPYVGIDDRMAAKTAVNYLLSVGKSRIAFLNSTLNFSYATLREQGYREALAEAGLPVHEPFVTHLSGIDFNMAYAVAVTLLTAPERPNAFFCASDVYACAVLKAVHNAGLSIPSDIAVMGFDNISLSSMTTPSISTVRQPTHQLGYQSCNLLIDKIEGLAVISSNILLPTEIVIRGST